MNLIRPILNDFQQSKKYWMEYPILRWSMVITFTIFIIYPFGFYLGYDSYQFHEKVTTLYNSQIELYKKSITLQIARGDSIISIGTYRDSIFYNVKNNKLFFKNLHTNIQEDTILIWKDCHLNYLSSCDYYGNVLDEYSYINSFKYAFNLNWQRSLESIKDANDKKMPKFILKLGAFFGYSQGADAKLKYLQQFSYNCKFGYQCFYNLNWWKSIIENNRKRPEKLDSVFVNQIYNSISLY